MRLFRLILVFAIGWSLALWPAAGGMAMADSAPAIFANTIGAAHDCCDEDQAPVDHMKNCQASVTCAKCFSGFNLLSSETIIHPPIRKAELWLTLLAIFSSPDHLPFRPPRA